MINTRKEKQLIEKIEAHLRKTARQMVQFDTLDETLHYLMESFHKQFDNDYMSIIVKQGDRLAIKSKKGAAEQFERGFPLNLNDCLPNLMAEPLSSIDFINQQGHCAFLSALETEKFQTWFTIPIRQENQASLGLCIIAFRSFVPLVLDADKLFTEYGKDIATAIALAKQKEYELKKVKGFEWIRENIYLGGTPLELIIQNIVERAGKGTDASSVFVYLYDEKENCLHYQPPAYGSITPPSKIDLLDQHDLTPFFEYLEKPGGNEITIPLIVNLKTIGILHGMKSGESRFSQENLELLQFLSSHVSVLIENARLFSSEKESKSRLEKFMKQQQELMKYTLEDNGHARISEFLSSMLDGSVYLFDRFLHLTSSGILDRDAPRTAAILEQVGREKKEILQTKRLEQVFPVFNDYELHLWTVIGAGDKLGYLGLVIRRKSLDMVLRMTINHALNVCAIQFIKQKLVLDVKEQVKDSFFNQLFAEKIQDPDKMMEYANLLNWNLLEPHSIALISIEFEESGNEKKNLIEVDAQKNWVWERIRDYIRRSEPRIVLTRKDGCFIAIVPQNIAHGDFWKTFYQRIRKLIDAEVDKISIYLGISQEAKSIDDYFVCYQQAQKTLALLYNRFRNKGFLHFHQLGSYTVLYNLGDPLVGPLFMKAYLEPLLHYGNGKGKDLIDTLRVYLQTNGSIKETSETLYIHRSSLKYRLEKIKEILKIDIEDAEQRFNLMLAYKLYDLHNNEISNGHNGK